MAGAGMGTVLLADERKAAERTGRSPALRLGATTSKFAAAAVAVVPGAGELLMPGFGPETDMERITPSGGCDPVCNAIGWCVAAIRVAPGRGEEDRRGTDVWSGSNGCRARDATAGKKLGAEISSAADAIIGADDGM